MPRTLAVLAAAPDGRLATAADVRAELGLKDRSVDNDLTALIVQASDLIAGACGGRTFGRETVRETIWLDGPVSSVLLSRDPVVAISSLVEGGTDLTDGTDFVVEPKAGILYRLVGDTRAQWCASKITVEYTAGWLLPSQTGANLPGDLRRACIERVARIWNGRGRDGAIRSETSQDVGQVTYLDPDKLSDEEMKGLRAYRRVSL